MSQENIHFFNQLITKNDLFEFRQNLLSELKEMLGNNSVSEKWLKSCEVKKMLKISTSTLQTMRINGTLRYTKIGNIFYYSYDDIEKLFDTK